MSVLYIYPGALLTYQLLKVLYAGHMYVVCSHAPSCHIASGQGQSVFAYWFGADVNRVPMDKPKEALAMLTSWLGGQSFAA